MSFNLARLQAVESEALAYSEGFPGTARLYGRINELQRALGAATATIHDAEIDRDLYLEALQAIYVGMKSGEMTTGGAMMLAGRVIP